MQRIPLTKASPGMVLAQAVCRSDGPVLVGEGQSLTESLIDRIRQAGIGSVWVEGNPLGGDSSVGNIRTIAESLPFVFRRQKDNVFMMTLHNVFARHFARKLAEQQAMEDERIRQAAANAATDAAADTDGQAVTECAGEAACENGESEA